jgi:hypothetical protein
MRVDIMTDIETLGTKADSTIIQISAIAFDIKTGMYISIFNQIADVSKNENPINVTGGTLQWWMNTNKELFNELLNGGDDSSEEVLRNFHKWITRFINPVNGNKDIYLWGNGILFDNKMIQHQMESLGLKYPIHYKNDRDVRTLLELTSAKTGLSESVIKAWHTKDNEVEHNALDDVKFQIRLAVGCYEHLTKELKE